MLEGALRRSSLLLLVYHAAQKDGAQHTVFLWQGMFFYLCNPVLFECKSHVTWNSHHT